MQLREAAGCGCDAVYAGERRDWKDGNAAGQMLRRHFCAVLHFAVVLFAAIWLSARRGFGGGLLLWAQEGFRES